MRVSIRRVDANYPLRLLWPAWVVTYVRTSRRFRTRNSSPCGVRDRHALKSSASASSPGQLEALRQVPKCGVRIRSHSSPVCRSSSASSSVTSLRFVVTTSGRSVLSLRWIRSSLLRVWSSLRTPRDRQSRLRVWTQLQAWAYLPERLEIMSLDYRGHLRRSAATRRYSETSNTGYRSSATL